ncbi:hypothetical protein EG829_27765, partial [bacterium]|nr:hypothetical protein [bacterium]
MAKRPRWLVFVSLAVVAAVVIAVALVVIAREVPGSVPSLIDFGAQDDSSDAADDESDAAAADNQLTPTEED